MVAPRMTLYTELTTRALKRAQANPWTIAWALAHYRRQHHLREAALVAWLEVPPGHRAQLGLCCRPDVASPRFLPNVAAIAAVTGCNGERLAQLLAVVPPPPAWEGTTRSVVSPSRPWWRR